MCPLTKKRCDAVMSAGRGADRVRPPDPQALPRVQPGHRPPQPRDLPPLRRGAFLQHMTKCLETSLDKVNDETCNPITFAYQDRYQPRDLPPVRRGAFFVNFFYRFLTPSPLFTRKIK